MKWFSAIYSSRNQIEINGSVLPDWSQNVFKVNTYVILSQFYYCLDVLWKKKKEVY